MIFEYDASFSKWVWCVTSLTDGKKNELLNCYILSLFEIQFAYFIFIWFYSPSHLQISPLYKKKIQKKNNIEEFKLNYYSMRVSCCHKQHKKQGFMKWVTGVCQYYSWPKPTNGFHDCPAEGAVDIKTDII